MSSDLQLRISQAWKSANENNINLDDLINLLNDCLSQNPNKELIYTVLDLAHLSSISKHVSISNKTDLWLELIIKLIKKSNYNFGMILQQRAKLYKDKTALNIINNGHVHSISYSALWEKVIEISKALSTFEESKDNPIIGLLTHNQANGAYIDLACISFGIKVIPIPLNATPEDVSYIIEHGQITHLFVGGKTGDQLWNEVKHKHSLSVISLNTSVDHQDDIIAWESFLEKGDQINNFDINYRLIMVDIETIQTIMYTSGTTSNPKGIVFNQLNLVSKRFARALALPSIRSNDIFLAYLPLFHTFGRYFELMGSIFWGACYSFAESPAFNSLLNDFKIIHPTIFISIPKRWLQLYDLLETELDLDSEKKSIIKNRLEEVTGGSLKWGLSAAGYLDPDIFSFFQTYGINLLSGYGMTEATGGITMTPPDDYQRESVGKALPGIELKLEKDGELCLRGPYVTEEYYKEENPSIFKDGWFHTEDIFQEKNGHYYILDRKKDIYKNSRGQTIAPQKIENLFQDFDSIKSVFLVGDGFEFNTVLIYPNYENSQINLKIAHEDEIREVFSSMILSVNSFLSPFERIINYVIIQRNFSKNKGEITQKGTFKRKQILKNFKDIILPLYEKNYLSLYYSSKEIRIPHWLLREIGTVKNNLFWEGKTLFISNQQRSIVMEWSGTRIQIGDFVYKTKTDILDLEAIIQYPPLWLGNISFTNFIGNSIYRLKEAKTYNLINIDISKIKLSSSTEIGLEKIDTILFNIHCLVHQYLNNNLSAFKNLNQIVDDKPKNWSSVIIDTFMNYQRHSDPIYRIKLIESLAPLLSGKLFISIFKNAYLFQKKTDPATGFSFDIKRTNDDHYKSIIEYLKNSQSQIENADRKNKEFIKTLLLLIADYGILHPTRFVWSRSELICWLLSDVPKPIHSTAQKAYYNLIKGFRSWIGKSASITVDPETGQEYDWKDAISFDENVRQNHQKRLLNAIIETSLIRESIFLFSKNYLIGLNDIIKHGIWITHIGSMNNKSVFRVLIKTRTFGIHNLVINLNEGWESEFFNEETKWLIMMSSGFKDLPLVENFGGYWPEHQLYTEEYIQGETLAAYLQRNKNDIKDQTKVDRWQMRWLHFIWNGIQAYQEFWQRTFFKLSIQPPVPDNLIIPQHDYKTGTKLISISSRKPIISVAEHFLSLYSDYIVHTEERYEGLSHMSDWEVVFTATLQALKVKKGKEVLNQLKLELDLNQVKKKCQAVNLTKERIDEFLEEIDNFGILTKPVVFASLRYERWLDLNHEATLNAKASILQELYKDYELDGLLDEYPETRVRFFMMTCFKGENQKLTNAFQAMIKELRQKKLSPWNIQERISYIQSTIELKNDEKFFLARMLFPHIDSADYVELVSMTQGEEARIDLVYQTECTDGKLYRIRPPFIPKEIAQFHVLLSESSLSVTFTSEHKFLFAFNNRNHLVGGLYWKNIDKDIIHLEWVAIRKKYQKISLSNRLMSDLYKRMKHLDVHIITVGFYAEKFFFKQGFTINKKYGGLVKEI